MKSVKVRRFEKGKAVCWGRYLFCKARQLWLRVGCESTGYECCAPESLPRGHMPPSSSRIRPQDAVKFEELCPEEYR